MWPFSKKTATMTSEQWAEKCKVLAEKLVKMAQRIGPQVGRTVFAGKNATADNERYVSWDVLAFCVHIGERTTRERFSSNMPATFLVMLSDACGNLLAGGANDVKKDALKRELRDICKERHDVYKNIVVVRAGKGEQDDGTLVDVFGRMMMEMYAGKNSLARAMLTAQGTELSVAVPMYMDELGMKAA